MPNPEYREGEGESSFVGICCVRELCVGIPEKGVNFRHSTPRYTLQISGLFIHEDHLARKGNQGYVLTADAHRRHRKSNPTSNVEKSTFNRLSPLLAGVWCEALAPAHSSFGFERRSPKLNLTGDGRVGDPS